MICKVTGDDGTGTYYVNQTSKTTHDFSPCSSGQPIKLTLDDLFALPGNIDRRCLLSVDTYHATAMVYSSSSRADLRAAQQRCSEPGASETG